MERSEIRESASGARIAGLRFARSGLRTTACRLRRRAKQEHDGILPGLPPRLRHYTTGRVRSEPNQKIKWRRREAASGASSLLANIHDAVAALDGLAWRAADAVARGII